MDTTTGRLRVLLVDDCKDIRRLSRIVLESNHPFEVWGEASNGEEAIALVSTGAPDLIVLDIMMPVMDGLTALPLLRALCPATPVIILAAMGTTPEVRRAALTLGACTVLDKADGIAQLPRVLLECLLPKPFEAAS